MVVRSSSAIQSSSAVRSGNGRFGFPRIQPGVEGSATGSSLLARIGAALDVWRSVGIDVMPRTGDRKPSAQPSPDGDLQAEIVPCNYHDEIAAMAAALEQFRDGMNRGRAQNADPDSERAAKAMGACPTQSQIAELEAAVRDALGSLRHSAMSKQAATSEVPKASDTCARDPVCRVPGSTRS